MLRRNENVIREHDPEKWNPVFPRDKRECVCAEIMLKQGVRSLSDSN